PYPPSARGASPALRIAHGGFRSAEDSPASPSTRAAPTPPAPGSPPPFPPPWRSWPPWPPSPPRPRSEEHTSEPQSPENPLPPPPPPLPAPPSLHDALPISIPPKRAGRQPRAPHRPRWVQVGRGLSCVSLNTRRTHPTSTRFPTALPPTMAIMAAVAPVTPTP